MFNPFRTKPTDESIEEAKNETQLYDVGKTTYTIHLKDGRKSRYIYTGYCYATKLFGEKQIKIICSKERFRIFLESSKNGFIFFNEKDKEEIFIPICDVDHISSVTKEFLASPDND